MRKIFIALKTLVVLFIFIDKGNIIGIKLSVLRFVEASIIKALQKGELRYLTNLDALGRATKYSKLVPTN